MGLEDAHDAFSARSQLLDAQCTVDLVIREVNNAVEDPTNLIQCLNETIFAVLARKYIRDKVEARFFVRLLLGSYFPMTLHKLAIPLHSMR